MGWIRVAAFGIVVAAGIAAALLWPGDVAANAIVPLTLIALYLVWVYFGDDCCKNFGHSRFPLRFGRLLRCTECRERDADFVVSGARP